MLITGCNINVLVGIVLRVKAIESLKQNKNSVGLYIYFIYIYMFCYILYEDCSWAVNQIKYSSYVD